MSKKYPKTEIDLFGPLPEKFSEEAERALELFHQLEELEGEGGLGTPRNAALLNALGHALELRSQEIAVHRKNRQAGLKGVEVKMKNTKDLHREWRDHARQYFEDYPDAPIKNAVDDIYETEVHTWEDITGGCWEKTQDELRKGVLDYSKVFSKAPKPRSKKTIWAVIANLAPKNQK